MDAEMEIAQPLENEGFSSTDIGAEILDMLQNSAQEEHHNVCATVGAISQALKEQGLTLTPVTYYAAAVSSFIGLSGDPSIAACDPDVSAILSFLSMILPRVPPAVLRNKGGIFSEHLARVIGCGLLPVSGVISALKCISHMLVIADKVNFSSVSQLYGVILTCITDNNFKVRNQSCSCLHDVLQSFQGSTILVLASEGITSALERFLLLCGSNPSSSSAGEEPKGAREVLYTLNALKDCIDLISIKSTNVILKYCKYLLDMHQSSVTRSIMEILQTLCSRQASKFPSESLLELLLSLAQFIPEKEKSADGTASIARLLNVGTKRVFSLNRNICIVKLPIIFNSLGEILAGEHEEAIFAATEALKSLIYSCIDEGLIQQGIEQIILNHGSGSRKSSPTIIEKICATIEGFLDFRYNAVWDMAFQVISAAFDQLGRYSVELMVGIVRNLADIQNLPDDDFSFKKQLHQCLGSALAAMGPEKFLRLLPLNLASEDNSDRNLWVIPILKQYTVGAELRFFSSYILDRVKILKQKSPKLERTGCIFSARNAEGLVYTLWSLFPSFCNYPVDVSTSFRDIQDILCSALRQEPQLHGIICSGLEILIQQNKSASEERSDVPDEDLSFSIRKAKEIYTATFALENLNALRSSPTLLSVLSDVFLEAPINSGGLLQSTIHLFSSISDRATVKKIFRKNMIELLKITKQVVRIKESKEPSSMQVDSFPDEASLTRARALRLDLVAMLIPGLDEEEIDLLFSATKPALQDEGLMQKKAYKILSLILKESECFLSSKLDELLSLIIMATATCHFSAKRHRLDCLYYLIVHISKGTSSEQKMREFISAFLTEILLSLKETNKKTRNKAYDLLVEIGHACGDEERGGKAENLHQFFSMVAGGLVSETPHMVSAAIKGLARLAYEFSDLISTAYKLLPSSFLLLQRKNREIIKANLGLIKVLVAKSKADGLETHLKGIIEGLLKWKDQSKNHFKAKIKSLIEMLVSKCGVDAVKAIIPEEHLKLLKNIRKIKGQKERKGSKSQADTNSTHSRTSFSRHSRWNHTRIFSDLGDDDGEEDGTVIQNGSSRAKTSFPASRASLRSKTGTRKAFKKSLPEDLVDQWDDDDPLDLLDRRKTRSILLPESKLKRKGEEMHLNDEPEMDGEGRIIVREDGAAKSKQHKKSCGDSDDGRSQRAESRAASSLSHNKKKRRTESGWSYTGGEYTSRKAGGDLKRKGKLEPYAYWPLDRKLLNRRAERKAMARKGMATVMLAKDLKKLRGMSVSGALAGGPPKRKKMKTPNK